MEEAERAMSAEKTSKEAAITKICYEQQAAIVASPAIDLADDRTLTDQRLSTWRMLTIMLSLSSVNLLNSFGLGVTTIALPRMVVDLQIPSGLTLWPATVNNLALGCCLLPAGGVADIVGFRKVSLLGTVLLMAFTLACGLSRSTLDLILFRALAGVGTALVQPTSVGIISTCLPHGRLRNIGFSCLGLGIPMGFAFGLVFGGLLESTYIGWRLGFYLCAGLLALFFALNFFFLPEDAPLEQGWHKKLRCEIDWPGALMFAAAFVLLSYVFSVLVQDTRAIREASTIALLCLGSIFLVVFALWSYLAPRYGRCTLIPTFLWQDWSFVTLCVTVFFVWAVLNSMEWFLSLYFQDIQSLSPLDASLRFLPNLIFGTVLEIVVGALIHRLPTLRTTVVACLLASVSPLLMVFNDPGWSFWRCEFWALVLLPVAADVLYTIANLAITDIFPAEKHALAGSVFNVVAQLGTSGGIAIMGLIASSVSQHQEQHVGGGGGGGGGGGNSSDGTYTLPGFVTVFWACFGMGVFAALAIAVGFRERRKVGT